MMTRRRIHFRPGLLALCLLGFGGAAPAWAQFDFDLEVVDPAYAGNGKPGWSAAGDIDDDGQVDVVSGGGDVIQWYKAPTWQKFPLETPGGSPAAGSNGGLVFDVDGDDDLDVVSALFLSSLVWWENPGTGMAAQGLWTRHSIDSLAPGFHHDLVRGDIDGDLEDEIVALYSSGGGGIYWYDIPADPTAGDWPRTRIVAGLVDPFVGLALGDIDDDADLDVVGSSSWYERPASATTADWTARTVFASAVQNVQVIDVNGDGRLDVVGAEGFVFPNGRVIWARAPADPLTQSFTEVVVATGLDGPENLWAGDLGSDGIVDLVTGEMGSSTGFGDSDSTLIVYERLTPDGLIWGEHVVAENVGVSARVAPIDIDGDGDVDFTADGNAEDHIYLWVNETPLPLAIPALSPPAWALLAGALVWLGARRLRH